MDGYPIIVLAPIFGLLANASSQILCAHLTSGKWLALSVAVGILVGLVISLVVMSYGLQDYLAPDPMAATVAVTLVSYLASAFCYWAFLNLNITSLRIRILKELLHSQGESVDCEAILTVYSPREIVERRIDRLLKGRYLVKQDDRLRTGRKELLVLERIVSRARSLVLPRIHATSKGKSHT